MADMKLSESILEIDIGSKIFAQDHEHPALNILRNLRFDLKAGEFCCIVGPSGSGKTTLLNLVSGLDNHYQGSITIAGNNIPVAVAPGYMFQSPRLMPWLTVRENLQLVFDESQDDRRIDNLLGEVGLEEFVDAYPNHLSDGMRRRVALARAIITEPELLLLDEPFISLDAPIANHLRRLLIDVCTPRSSTVLFVTHDLREALYLADRILFISSRPGTIVLDQPVKIPRPREPESKAIELMRFDLLRQHPQLLSGLVESDENTPV